MATYRFYWEDTNTSGLTSKANNHIVSQDSDNVVIKMYDNSTVIGNGSLSWVNQSTNQSLDWTDNKSDEIILDMTNFDFRSAAEARLELSRKVYYEYDGNAYIDTYSATWPSTGTSTIEIQDLGELLFKDGVDLTAGSSSLGLKYLTDDQILGYMITQPPLPPIGSLDGYHETTSLDFYNDFEVRAQQDPSTLPHTPAYGNSGADNYGTAPDSVEIILPEGYTYRIISNHTDDFPNRSYLVIYEPDDPSNPELTGQPIIWDFRIPDGATITTVACFTDGAQIRSENGTTVPIEELQEGDLVETRDHGLQPVRWMGKSVMYSETLMQFPNRRPIIFRAGALGFDHPEFRVSPQHKIFTQDERLRSEIGSDEGLIPAKHLVNDTTILVDHSCEQVTYYHMLLGQHEIVNADGVWSESFYPGAYTMDTLDHQTRSEISFIFPDLTEENGREKYGPLARPSVKRRTVEKYLK